MIKLKYVTLTLGIIAIILVTVINFYPEKVEQFINDKSVAENRKTVVKQAKEVLTVKKEVEATALDKSKFEDVCTRVEGFAYTTELQAELGTVYTEAKNTRDKVKSINTISPLV